MTTLDLIYRIRKAISHLPPCRHSQCLENKLKSCEC